METRGILIVDDEESVRNALRRTLRREGYDVTTAAGPAEALELLKQGPFDMVISDHLMPEMSGLEFLKIVRDRHPHVCRMILTGHADMDTAIRAINEGEIYRFLSKPWDNLDLLVTLNIAFEQIALEGENRRLLSKLRVQDAFLGALERRYPGIVNVERDESGAIVIDEASLTAQVA